MWEVLTLFLVPIGGGIPAGVLLARNKGFDWWIMLALYFVSDVILALLFEPLLLLVVRIGQRSPFILRLREAFRKHLEKTTSSFKKNMGPLALITISFGVDPMTGRAAAAAAGHGFVMGWCFAIAGDLVYFAMLMVSTLWLSNVLGDGTWATLIILVAMTVVPVLFRRRNES